MTTPAVHHPAPRAGARDDLVALARRYAAEPERWPALRFDPYQRWYRRLAVGDGHEAWLLTWLPRQHTDLHDHGPAGGVFLVLFGTLQEEVVAQAGPPGVRAALFRAGEVRAFGPHHVHRVGNAGTTPAVSLHVYAPVLTTMTRYAMSDTGLHIVGVERTGVDW